LSGKPRVYTAWVQWNSRKTSFTGYIPGIGGTESWGGSMDELKGDLSRNLAERLKERGERRSRAGRPPAGYHRIDIKA
jgi:hypothetical protein